MKKALLSSLCSALVIPGLGQILNQEIKKGVFIFLVVFALFVLGVIRLYQMINAVLQNLPINRLDPENVMEGLKAQDHSFLWILLLVFACV
jgi:TM2 domain-containing membrane protein YozV